MGKCCWMEWLCHVQQLFPIQIPLSFPIFKLLPNFIFECSNRPQTWWLCVFLHALFISGIHKLPGLKFKGGYSVARSCDQVPQRAYSNEALVIKINSTLFFLFWVIAFTDRNTRFCVDCWDSSNYTQGDIELKRCSDSGPILNRDRSESDLHNCDLRLQWD